jgi:hypothetical protein
MYRRSRTGSVSGTDAHDDAFGRLRAMEDA